MEVENLKSYRLLLLGAEWQIEAFRAQKNSSDVFHFVSQVSYRTVLSSLQDDPQRQFYSELEKVDVLFLIYEKHYSEEFIKMISEIKHKIEVVLIHHDEDINLKVVINEWNVKKIISFEDFSKISVAMLAPIFKKINAKHIKNKIIKDISVQKKQLDELILKQEVIVNEKTQDISHSTKEEDKKLKKERVILRFIKDMALVNSFEDFLRVIKNEFKVFHEIGEILLFQKKTDKLFKVLFSKNYFQWKEIPFSHALSEESLNDKIIHSLISIQLANSLSRPFGKLKLSQLSNESFIGFENQLSDIHKVDFEEFLHDRIEVIHMAHEKLFLEITMVQFSNRWEKTFDLIDEPIAIIDENYQVLRSNSFFEKNLHSLKCYEMFAQRTSVCLGCPLKETIESNSAQKRDLNITKSNFELYSYPMKSTFSLRSVVHNYIDRTQEKKLYSRLLQTEKMLSIGRLAGHLSHELNNPLTGIRSMVQYLKTQVAAETTAAKDLVEIEKATERCFKVMNNFIEFSNPKNTNFVAMNLDEIIQKTIPLLKVPLRSHQLDLQLASQNVEILADPSLVQHVIFNLIQNATQAMKEKGTILVSTDVSKKKISLKISDSGEGIALENQSLIFEPFFTTKPEGEGTGLGLSIVKSVVENSQGSIRFEPNHPQGATFIIEWPIYENTNH